MGDRQGSQLTVRAEVERLLAEMRSHVLSIDDMRDTIHVQAIVRQTAIPEIPSTSPVSLVRALARATLLGAWVQHDASQRGFLAL